MRKLLSHYHQSRAWRNIRAMLALCVCMFVALDASRLSAQQSKELDSNHVMAQMILNFPLVTTWPTMQVAGDGKVHLCSLSDHPVARDVQAMVSVSKAAVQYRFMERVSDSELAQCHVLLIAEQDSDRWQSIQKTVTRLPILSVGMGKGFLRNGGVIGFVLSQKNLGVFSEQTVRFDVHLKAAQAVGLTLDPMLLELAESIVTD